jgi:Uma2 family endonuclease
MSIDFTTTYNDAVVTIPSWLVDHSSFLRWVNSAEAPEKGKYEFYHNQLWMDASRETLFHNQIKSIINRHLGIWAEQQALGDYFDDGMLMSQTDLSISCEPDGMFIAEETYSSGEVTLQHGDKSMTIVGSPDMVLEVISKSSVLRDTKTKRQLYHQAGVREYWVVDSRLAQPTLVIYQRGSKTYVPVKAKAGWLKSNVFGASFKLTIEGKEGERRKVKLLRR